MKCKHESGLTEGRYCWVANKSCKKMFASHCKSYVPDDKIVRCSECVFWHMEPMGEAMMCYGFANGHWTEPEDFCSRGRKR